MLSKVLDVVVVVEAGAELGNSCYSNGSFCFNKNLITQLNSFKNIINQIEFIFVVKYGTSDEGQTSLVFLLKSTVLLFVGCSKLFHRFLKIRSMRENIISSTT